MKGKRYAVTIVDNITGHEQVVIRTMLGIKAMKRFDNFTIVKVNELGKEVAKY